MAIILALAGLVDHGLAQERVIDGLVARVDRSVLLRSDLELAALVGLGGENPSDTELARRRVVLEQQFLDLESSGELDRMRIDRHAVTEELSVRFPIATEIFGREAIWGLAFRLEAVERHVSERLSRRIAVSRAELEQAWREELGSLERPPELESVRDQLERLVAERKLNAEIEGWEQTVAKRWPAWCPVCGD